MLSWFFFIPCIWAFEFEIHHAPQPLRVGDPVELHLVWENAPADCEFFADPKRQDIVKLDKLRAGDLITVWPLQPGHILLEGVTAKAVGKEYHQSKPLAFDVVSAIDAKDPHPKEPEQMAPPVAMQYPLWFQRLMKGLIGILLAAALFFVGIACFKAWREWRWKRAQRKMHFYDYALAEIERIKMASLSSKLKAFELSEALREFFGKRFECDASQATTREFVKLVHSCAPLHEPLIEKFCAELDIVKFTKFDQEKEMSAACFTLESLVKAIGKGVEE